ncbi:DUF5996 family protein [Streptomyces sp. NPDC002078]
MWPRLRVASWTETRETLHMWTRIVGKIRLAHPPGQPLVAGHHVRRPTRPCHVGDPYGSGGFEIESDFHDHQLCVRSSDGPNRSVGLEPRPVPDPTPPRPPPASASTNSNWTPPPHPSCSGSFVCTWTA